MKSDNEIARLTALNAAKSELIEFYDKYISGLNGYLQGRGMGPSQVLMDEGERLRARIRGLESE